MATIIRKNSLRASPSGPAIQPIAFSFGDIRDQASDYLEMVRGEAAKIVQEAHRQAEQIRRQAETAGRQEAEAAIDRMLEDRVAKRMDTLLPALERTAAELDDAKGDLLRQWESCALRVATAMAQRIIRRELAQEPQIALDVIAEALRLATGTSEITLHVNPTDHSHLGSQIERLADALCRITPAQVIADASIAPGGCRLTTKFGEIDLQIESQLRRIEEDLQ
jgi:flagellar assembly protein FliH